ncbi:hypothetical protein ECTT12B_3626, partial [Escherichia coli TT12B]
PAPG